MKIEKKELESEFLKTVSDRLLPLAEMTKGDNERVLIVIATDEQSDKQSALVGALAGRDCDIAETLVNLIENDDDFSKALEKAMKMVVVKHFAEYLLNKED